MNLNKLKKLEDKLNTASDIIDGLTFDESPVTEILEPDVIPPDSNTGNPVARVSDSLLSTTQLKEDFEMIRRNTIKLINTGQQLLDRAQLLDISDMKSSQIEALSNLQSTIGTNLKMMMEIYKDLVEIENNNGKRQDRGKSSPVAVNNGTVNNISFTGTNDELLRLIKENS